MTALQPMPLLYARVSPRTQEQGCANSLRLGSVRTNCSPRLRSVEAGVRGLWDGMEFRGRVLPVTRDALSQVLFDHSDSPAHQKMREGLELFCECLLDAKVPATLYLSSCLPNRDDEKVRLEFVFALDAVVENLTREQLSFFAGVERLRQEWEENWLCDIDYFFQEHPGIRQEDMIDHWLRYHCSDGQNTPVDALKVELR